MKGIGMSEFPEHERLKAVEDEALVISQFLEWLQRKYEICNPTPLRGRHFPAYIKNEEVMADYFDIDLKVIADEKDQMVEEMRKMNKQETKP